MSSDQTITIEDFGTLYEKYGPMVLRRCRYLLKDEEKALDCMQDVFVRLFERRTSLCGVCASLFYTTATRVCLNKIRSDKVRSSVQIDTLIQEIVDTNNALHTDITDAALFLDSIFETAKEDTRDMAVMHFIDGLTLEETASAMNMSVSGVRKRLLVLKKKALHCAGNE
jgi:RNA polymerase sigma-70 factor (ECF subfamily)